MPIASRLTVTQHTARDPVGSVSLSKLERKRIQNRRNQKAYRLREAEKARQPISSTSRPDEALRIAVLGTKGKPSVYKDWKQFARPNGCTSTALTCETPESTNHGGALLHCNVDAVLPRINAQACSTSIPKQIYWEWAVTHPDNIPDNEIPRLGYDCNTLHPRPGSRPAFRFPLSPDHKILIIQYNLYRATKANKDLLSPWLVPCPLSGTVPKIADGLVPVSLQPTALQQAVIHPAWISIFPHPRVRDNIILRQNEICWDDMMADLAGYLYPCHTECSRDDHSHMRETDHHDVHDIANTGHGLIVWGDPWIIENWELTPSFVRKWRWTLKGCHDMIEASNKWRALRHEPPILEVLD